MKKKVFLLLILTFFSNVVRTLGRGGKSPQAEVARAISKASKHAQAHVPVQQQQPIRTKAIEAPPVPVAVSEIIGSPVLSISDPQEVDFSSVLTVTIAFVLPNQSLANPSMRNKLRQYLAEGLLPRNLNLNNESNNNNNSENSDGDYEPVIPHRLHVNPVYTSGFSVSQTVNNVFCSRAAQGVNAILIMTDKMLQGDDGTRMANFLTTLAATVGIPTLAWSTSSFELEQSTYDDKNRLLLAPKLSTIAQAMFDFLKARPFQKISLIGTALTPGYETFTNELNELNEAERRTTRFLDIHRNHGALRLTHVSKLQRNWRESAREELIKIRDSAKTRIIILYAKPDEANEILGEARTLGMTAEEYTWICAKAVLGDDNSQVPVSLNFVPGTIVFTYDTSFSAQLEVLKGATYIWSTAVRKLMRKLLKEGLINEIVPNQFCETLTTPKPWPWHEAFMELLSEAKIDLVRNEEMKFEATVGRVILKYLDQLRRWEDFGEWTPSGGLVANTSRHGEIIRQFTDSTTLRVVTLEEPPYVIYGPTDHAGNCPRQALLCTVMGTDDEDDESTSKNTTVAELPFHESLAANDPHKRPANTTQKCCSGFCIDLLQKLITDIGFKYYIYEVPDRKWGVKDKVTEEWNGLVRAVLDKEADVIMTSMKINKERSEAIEFGIPFLETGITMVVAVRQGAISPMAFIEPFSPPAWAAILFGCANAVVISSFFFEYFSLKKSLAFENEAKLVQLSTEKAKQPSLQPLFSMLWLIWAMLFKASVRVQVPKSLGAKLLIGIWGAFCVIFASSYMANLAVFMITKDDYYDFSGIEDYRLKNPYTKNPPYRFGTLTSGATEAFMRQNHPDVFEYMRQFNQSSANAGIEAVKKGNLDAFIYDATVLDFKSNRDKDCRLTTVGKWYAMTGYAVGFPKGSKWLPTFDKYIIDYQHNSFLQQQSEFWLGGACKRKKKQDSNKSSQLGILNFTSAFVLLLLGLGCCFFILILEMCCSKYIVRCLGLPAIRAVRAQVRRQLVRTYFLSPFAIREDNDLASIGLNSMVCNNCGGRGHFAQKCVSPRGLNLLPKKKNYNFS